MAPFSSDRSAALRAITDGVFSVSDAIAAMAAEEALLGGRVPEIYVSTAISSGGHYWNPEHAGCETSVIEANGRSAGLFLAEIERCSSGFLTRSNVMVPTELGTVFRDSSRSERWADSDYLYFYFGWLSGLSASGADALVASIKSDKLVSESIRIMDDRDLTHTARWPAYAHFVDVLCSRMAVLLSKPRMTRGSASHTLLQLVDTNNSLGSRAERRFAQIRGLQVVAPLLEPEHLGSDTSAELRKLRALDSGEEPLNVGVPLSHGLVLAKIS